METKQAAQVAILAGIATAALSRVLSHIIVYRRETYKATVDQYHAVIARQQEIIKLTPRQELYGRKSTPAKAEFQANISQS